MNNNENNISDFIIISNLDIIEPHYDFVATTFVQVDIKNRININESDYFNIMEPGTCNDPEDGIYTFSFALRPSEHRPSGTCNFSKMDNIILRIYVP